MLDYFYSFGCSLDHEVHPYTGDYQQRMYKDTYLNDTMLINLANEENQ